MKEVIVFAVLLACTFAAPNKYIINGEQASVEDYPYQVSIQWGDFDTYYHICGGAIISEKLVLTAKHCCGSYTNKQLHILINTDDIKVTGKNKDNLIETKKLYYVDEIITEILPSKLYSSRKGPEDNDLCILKINNAFESDIVPIKIIDTAIDPASELTLTGWGVSDEGANFPNTELKKATGLTILKRESELSLEERETTESCEARLTSLGFDKGQLFPHNMCTDNNGKTACNGDSGGPLVLSANDPNPKMLVGIVSWGIAPCDHEKLPTIYTSLLPYSERINNLIDSSNS